MCKLKKLSIFFSTILSAAIFSSCSDEDSVTSGNLRGHEYVDLGLPSGLKWATCNIGAESPSDFGNYYMWGYTEDCSNANCVESACKTSGVSIPEFSGNAEYDAATANWGGSWRMPKVAEIEELGTYCTLTWTTVDNVKGYKVTGKNGNFIFLPAAGYRYGTSFEYQGEEGYYWSSSNRGGTYYGCTGCFYVSDFFWYNSNRAGAHTIRPVSD